ncbi:hypothetical protein [Aeromicrobium sp.]|uniref:hypothetical protein n=1 Tax=Aeromicrobium sp. TaxID=1871063 RepID=UPI0019BFEF02|nr:hypothetical protein [Aeromicrobium sp.]MBC7630789.1 hypothetical protein [Aeromicrobium sp.]
MAAFVAVLVVVPGAGSAHSLTTVSPSSTPVATPASAVLSIARTSIPVLPKHIDGGTWSTSHLQGAAVDTRRGEIYWSFTQQLVRTNMEGTVLGTVGGLAGHLGDLDLNPQDGRVYGSLEYKAQKAFYIAIFDPRKIDRIGMDAEQDGVMTTVHLSEVVDDFTADMDGNGVFDGDTATTADHRYGSSGIDGVAFGPSFGRTSGPQTLKVAYGIYSNVDRHDNDNQVILEYDTRSWRRYERPLSEQQPHRSGPPHAKGKFFVPTGNTTYGIQNLEYDEASGNWFAGVYPGVKPGMPRYSLFIIDGHRAPRRALVSGQARPEEGDHLALVDSGLHDPGSAIFGWTFDAAYGLVSLGQGYFYKGSASSVVEGGVTRQHGALDLYRWTGRAPTPFEKVS